LGEPEAGEVATGLGNPEDCSVVGDQSGHVGPVPVSGVGRWPPEDGLVDRVLTPAGVSEGHHAFEVISTRGSD